jgi:hypothetical protein
MDNKIRPADKEGNATAPAMVKRLRILSRISAAALFLTVVVLVLSGWGITKTGIIYHLSAGLIDRGAANDIHRKTNVPLAVFFLVHITANIRLLLTRRMARRIWIADVILALAGAGLLALFLYVEYWAKGG